MATGLIYRSFNDWSARGYMIKKGSKAAGRDENGTPLFSEEQVKPKWLADAYRASDENEHDFDPQYDDPYNLPGIFD